jgi:phosphatidate cytidylyltransferase
LSVLLRRIVSGLVYGVVTLSAVYLGGVPFVGAVMAMVVLGGREYQRMLGAAGYAPLRVLQYGLTGFLVIGAAWLSPGLMVGGLALILVSSLAWQLLRTADSQQSFVEWALTLAGGLYLGLLSAYFVLLRALPGGLEWMLLVLAATWGCDSLAYVCGSVWGRHGFFTSISPHKTAEGALAGFLGGTAITGLLGMMLGYSLPWALGLGLVSSLAAICGDLAESLVKRQMGVKDSGGLVPGHGGMLDRVDSLLFAVVFAYYYISLMPR